MDMEIKKFNDFSKINEAKKYYQELDFESKEEYYDYFCETFINGQFSQFKKMVKVLRDNKDLRNCLNYLKDSSCTAKHLSEIKDFIIDNE